MRRGWRWGGVEKGMEVESCGEGDGGGETLRRGWRQGAVEEGMEVGSSLGGMELEG